MQRRGRTKGTKDKMGERRKTKNIARATTRKQGNNKMEKLPQVNAGIQQSTDKKYLNSIEYWTIIKVA